MLSRSTQNWWLRGRYPTIVKSTVVGGAISRKRSNDLQQNWWLAERYQQMLSRSTAELMTERALSNNSKIDCRTRGWRCVSQPALKRSTTELVIGRAFSNKRWKDLQQNWWLAERSPTSVKKIYNRTGDWQSVLQQALKRSTTELVIGRAFSNKR